MNINNNWIKTGALIAALAAALGAFDLQPNGESSILSGAEFTKAIIYQMVHGLAIVIVGTLMMLRPGRLLKTAGVCFLLGTMLFSGSTYLLLLTGVFWLAYLKLVGVVLLVLGWIMLVEGACPGWNKTKEEVGQGTCAVSASSRAVDKSVVDRQLVTTSSGVR